MSDEAKHLIALARVAAGNAHAPYSGFGVGAAVLLTDGSVVELMPDWRPEPIGLHLLTPPSPLRPARVEALIAYLSDHLRD